MGKTIVQGAITSEHKWLTVMNFEASEVTLIQAWYWNPEQTVKFVEGDGVTVTVKEINRNITSNDKCWTCGLPVETGEKFCNDACKKANTLNVITDEK